MEEIEESFQAFGPTEAAKAVKSGAAAKAERAGIEKKWRLRRQTRPVAGEFLTTDVGVCKGTRLV